MTWPLLLAAAATYFPPPDSAGGWRALNDRVAIRRQTGIDVARLDEAFQYAKSTKHGGLLVVRDGWLVYERYFGKGSREALPNTASCGKTFTSIALGILIHERPDLFPDGLDQKVFTPRYLSPPEAFPLNDPAKAEIRLGQLLAMTAGIRPPRPPSPSPQPPRGEPRLVAARRAVHVASIVLRQVTGMELEQFLDYRLAKPLGWGRWGFGYRRPEIAHTPGGGGIRLRATDMLRFAYLLLREGRWQDRQLVPASYVRHCGRRSPYNPHFPYSLQFNVGDGDGFSKSGSGGHCFYVVPSLDLVVYKIGGRDEQYDPAKPYDGSRERWTSSAGPDSIEKTLQMVVAAISPK